MRLSVRPQGRTCVALLAITIATCGCESFSSKNDSWVGHDWSEYVAVSDRATHIEQRQGPTDAGTTTFKERVETGADCVVYWDVNSAGKMVSWRSEGSSCKWYNY